jgi:hypothetical protein
MVWCPPRVFVLFFFVLCTLWCGVHHVFLFSFSSSCVPYGVVSTTCFCLWWTPHHRVHRTKKNKAKTRGGHHTIGYTGRRKTKQKHVVDTTPLFCFSSSCVPYVCGVHHGFLFSFSSSCVPYGVVSTTCFCFVFLRPRGGHHTIGYTGRRKTKQKPVVDTTP